MNEAIQKARETRDIVIHIEHGIKFEIIPINNKIKIIGSSLK